MAAYMPHTPLQDAIMAELRKHPSGMSWKDLKQTTGKTLSSMSRAVILLEAAGKVRRDKILAPKRRGVRKDYWRVSKVLIKLVEGQA